MTNKVIWLSHLLHLTTVDRRCDVHWISLHCANKTDRQIDTQRKAAKTILTSTSTSNIGFSVKRWFNGNLGRHNDASNEIRALLIAKLIAAFVDTFSHGWTAQRQRTHCIIYRFDLWARVKWSGLGWAGMTKRGINVLNGLSHRKR